jgi:hypothetical protein
MFIINKIVFLPFDKKTRKKMKKIIALGILLLGSILIFSACDTQHRCAAYGHYTYNMPAENPDNMN